MKNDFRKIKMDDVLEAIKNRGFYYTPTERHYGKDFIGPKLIIVTDDPDFVRKNPSLAEMIIMTSEKFEPIAEEFNRYLLNDQREYWRHINKHNADGYYEDCCEDENGNCNMLKIKDMDMNPVENAVIDLDSYEHLHKTIEKLDDIQKERLKMYYFEEKTQ